MSDAPGPSGGPAAPPADAPPPPEYTKYRARPRLLPERGGDALAALRRRRIGGDGDGARSRRSKPWTAGRVLRWVGVALLAWIAISIASLLISAGTGNVSSRTEAALESAGYPLWSANNILVLGSDARPQGSQEPGADPGGPSRADSIMVLRIGGGHSSRLSIARDTVVDIPGVGSSKINAAYAYGGPALQIRTVEQYLGIPINHVILVDFEHFPKLVDALGGITYKGGCVVSKINGGARNGGYTLRLQRGTHHLNGEQALALSRTRKNECNAAEDDLDRAAHQQAVLSAMKSKVASFGGLFGIPHGSFYRLPFVGWEAPKAMRTDMSGPTLAGVFGALAIGGSPKTAVLGTESGIVPDAMKQTLVRRFLKG